MVVEQEKRNPRNKVIHNLASHFKATSEQFWAGQYLPTDLSQYYFHATLTGTLITKYLLQGFAHKEQDLLLCSLSVEFSHVKEL